MTGFSIEGGLFGYGKTKRQDVVSPLPPDVGKPDTEPLLATVPGVQRFRLRPAEERIIQVKTVPESETHLEDVLIDVEPKIAGLEKEEEQTANGVRVRLLFTEPEDFDVDEYPLESTLSVLAKLKGHDKLRLLERDIVVNPRPGPRPPKPPPTLYDTPSVLKVISRQPIKLIPGTLSAHVKMRWDGEDYLTGGVRPKWRITARCLSIASFPAISSSRPRQGRFELLLDTPHGLIPKQELEFEVVASGPERKEIKATFRAVVADVEPPLEARAIRVKAPEHGASRRPPYKLKYVKQPDWSSETCWGGTQWSEYDAGAFQEPTASDPLILMINQDMDALRELREDLVKRKIAESSIKQRMTHYSTHIGFHLYQMYHAKKDRDRQAELSDDARAPQDTEFRDEIRRVAMTLLKLMVGIRG